MSSAASSSFRGNGDGNDDFESVVSESVQSLVTGVYREFERLIAKYDSDVVKELMPLVVQILENLNRACLERAEFEQQCWHLRNELKQTSHKYTLEKDLRRSMEQRSIEMEESFADERQELREKNVNLESSGRALQMKLASSQDQISRLEEQIAELKGDLENSQRRCLELSRAHVLRMSSSASSDTLQKRLHESSPVRSIISDQGEIIIDDDYELALNSKTEHGGDSVTGDGGSNEDASKQRSDTGDSSEPPPPEVDNSNNMSGLFDSLVAENHELRDVKHALNIVNNDLLWKVAELECELLKRDDEIHAMRERLNALEERYAQVQESTKRQSSSFSSDEISRLVTERNDFKERLLELQEAVRLMGQAKAREKLQVSAEPRSSGDIFGSAASGLMSFFSQLDREEDEPSGCYDEPTPASSSNILLDVAGTPQQQSAILATATTAETNASGRKSTPIVIQPATSMTSSSTTPMNDQPQGNALLDGMGMFNSDIPLYTSSDQPYDDGGPVLSDFSKNLWSLFGGLFGTGTS